MILIEEVSKNFNGKTVVDALNLQINSGEAVGFLGPNGAGKTTTIRMLAGVLPPSQGKILIDGQNLFDLGAGEKAKIGYLPENNPLYENLTVEEFLNFWLRLKKIKGEVEKGLKNLVKSLGLGEVYYRPISELSKGYRQRVGLSQALLGEPEILLLDEPTEGLDPNQRQDIQNLIKGLGEVRTVIICSHVLSEITKMCRRIIIINQGRVVANDSVEGLTQISQEKQIITLVAKGERIKASLENLAEVTRVQVEAPDRFRIEAFGPEDLRGRVFSLAKNNNWELLELRAEKVSLEEVFARLTQ